VVRAGGPAVRTGAPARRGAARRSPAAYRGPMTMPREAMERVGRLLGSEVVTARVAAGGYSNNARWLVGLADGRSAFVKQAVDGPTREWLRREQRAYAHLSGPWLPEMLAWEDGTEPVLILEDLSAHAWPPPWTVERVQAVKAALADIAAQPVPPGAGRLPERDVVEGGWPEVARDPGPLLGLGLCDAAWLEAALPTLVATADPSILDGDGLCHLDVRSDNLCFRDGQAVLIDWNHAARGNPEFDLAFWLPSLHAEGGPPPHEVGDVDPGVAAFVAGFFASRAGLPVIPHAPGVREIQRVQLEIALPWASAALGLPVPTRHNRRP
jgi:hypothetical protein